MQLSLCLNLGTILCSLMSYPDVLICNENGWSPTPTSGIDGICKGVSYDTKEKMFSFTLGGQVFSGSMSRNYLNLHSFSLIPLYTLPFSPACSCTSVIFSQVNPCLYNCKRIRTPQLDALLDR